MSLLLRLEEMRGDSCCEGERVLDAQAEGIRDPEQFGRKLERIRAFSVMMACHQEL